MSLTSGQFFPSAYVPRAYAFTRTVVTLLLAAGSLRAATITVTSILNDGPGSLRAVVAGAASHDTIVFDTLLSGATNTLTTGQIPLDKDLTIDASALPDGIFISGNTNGNGELDPGESRIFEVPSGVTVTLRGLSLINGQVSLNDQEIGGAIFNSGNLTLEKCVIASCSAYAGGGISNDSNGSLTLTQTTLSRNSARWYGGGVRKLSGTMTVTGSTLSDNTCGYTGGGIDNADGTVTITRSMLTNNSAGFDGGGINNVDGTVTITQARLSENSTRGFGGGISNGGPLTIADSTLSDNRADSGGGIHNSGTATVTRVMLSGNTSRGRGGGIHHNWGSMTIFQSMLSGNSAYNNGGGIYNSGTMDLIESTLSGNSTEFSGGCIANGYGGTVDVTQSTLSENSAGDFGGGIANIGDGTVDVTQSTLFGNSAGWNGGGIDNRDGEVTVNHSTLSGNSAEFDGGGIANNGSLNITLSTLSGNSAGSGDGIINYSGSGGGIINYIAGTVSVTQSTLSSNSAGYSGGGIENLGGLNITLSTLSGNSTVSFGGGIYNHLDSAMTLTQSTLSGNSALIGGAISTTGMLTLTRSIVSGNSGELVPNIDGTISTNINSLISGDPLLAPLGDYGGPTQTMPPLPGSPAIDSGGADPSPFATDQRGAPRVFGAAVDIGAVEFIGSSGIVDSDADSMDDLLEPLWGFVVGEADGHLDADGDGSTNAEELGNKTNPRDPASLFRLLTSVPAGVSPNGHLLFDMTWTSFPGLSYTLQTASNPDFSLGSENVISMVATGFTHTWCVEWNKDRSTLFARVRRE